MIVVPKEEKYNYDKYIMYQDREEEEEAAELKIKNVVTDHTAFPLIGKTNGATFSKLEDKWKELYNSGKTIEWKELRKQYAKYLDTNPFEVGDIVKCIDLDSSPGSEKIGETYKVLDKIGDKIKYSESEYSPYINFTLEKQIAKDWIDEFLTILPDRYSKITYSGANTLTTNRESTCTVPACLMAYITLFSSGGFWLENGNIHFVVNGSSKSHSKATAEHAREFIEQWKQKDKI